MIRAFLFQCITLVVSMVANGHGQEPTVLPVWPSMPPGESGKLPEESDSTKPTDGLVAGKPVIRWANVQSPTLTLYRPAKEKDTGAAVLVCPGGGYNILAMDLEGTETCEWLNSIGVTTALLKYRVPRREGRPPHEAPLQDAQRAMNLLRHQASSLGIDPARIGCLGYSAGGNLCGLLSTRFSQRSYDAIDDADKLIPRPDFCMLIYPAYLVDPKNRAQLSDTFKIPNDAPPMFLTMAQDDPLGCENILVPAMELTKLKIPCGLHLFPSGGHGYGHRRTNNPVTQWTDQAEGWLRERGILKPN
jgi:acetyl esterase/lipase